MPEGWSKNAVDFINGLIKRKPIQRLGANGPSEIKIHPWFKDFDWESLNSYKMESPFNPPSEVSFENQNRESEWQDMNEENLQDCIEFLEKESFQELFANYEYDEEYQPISKINLRNNYNNSQYPRAVNTLCGNPMFE